MIFKETDKKLDILKFIIKAIYAKHLHESACRIFELIQKLTNLYPTFIKSFSSGIVDISIQCLKCIEPSARFKELTVLAVDGIISREALDEDYDINKIIKVLMSVLEQDVKNRRKEIKGNNLIIICYSNHPNFSVFNHTYDLLGKISKKYPEKFTPEIAVKLRDKMVTTIQDLFKGEMAKVSLSLISGVVLGLKNHLENFTPKVDEDENFNRRLYECMFELSNAPFKHANNSNIKSSRVPFRNMLFLVHEYGNLVGDYIYEDYMKWHKILLQWIDLKTYDDLKAGVLAMQTVHLEIAKAIERRNNQNDKAVLLFFMNYFQKTLELPTSQPHEIRIAIRGFGSFSGACKMLLEQQYLSDRFDLVMQRTEYSYFTGDESTRMEVLEHLPNFIESLSKIMNHLNEISGIQLQSLQSVVVILIKDFHYFSTSHHQQVTNALLETFINLEKSGGKIFSDLIETVIWQGILWTCRHQVN